MNHSEPPPEVDPSIETIDARTKHLVTVVEYLRKDYENQSDRISKIRSTSDDLYKTSLTLSATALRLYQLANPMPLWMRASMVIGGSFFGGLAGQMVFRVFSHQ